MKDVGSGRHILSNFRTEIFHIETWHDNQCRIEILMFVFIGHLPGIKKQKTDVLNYLLIYLTTDLLVYSLHGAESFLRS
jgi:chaperone required for assembly of F1-ATPase